MDILKLCFFLSELWFVWFFWIASLRLQWRGGKSQWRQWCVSKHFKKNN